MKKDPSVSLKRGEFLRSLGLSTSALMAFYCMGTSLSGCRTDDDTPAPDTPALTGITTGNRLNFTLDLSSETYKVLLEEGRSVVVGDALVVALAGGQFIALSKSCTHMGTTIRYPGGGTTLICPNHGSQFELDGTVRKGPAASPLTVFVVTLSADGKSLNVRA